MLSQELWSDTQDAGLLAPLILWAIFSFRCREVFSSMQSHGVPGICFCHMCLLGSYPKSQDGDYHPDDQSQLESGLSG